ncbi:MAG TPA: hypothetical protein PLC53_00020 [Bacilli bacterium]|nr:hypothetical protein [Bacilli bacterium]
MIDVKELNGQLKITGPKDYMESRGHELIERISSGLENEHLSMYLKFQPHIPTAIKVFIQTDYANWKGMNQIIKSIDK